MRCAAWIRGGDVFVAMDYVEAEWLNDLVWGVSAASRLRSIVVWGYGDLLEVDRLRRAAGPNRPPGSAGRPDMPEVRDVQGQSPAAAAGIPHGKRLDVAFSVAFRPRLMMHGVLWSVATDKYWPEEQRSEAKFLLFICRQISLNLGHEQRPAGSFLEVWRELIVPRVVGFSKQPQVRVKCLKKAVRHEPSPDHVDYRRPAIHESMPSLVRGRERRASDVAPQDRDGSVYALTDALTTLLLGLQAFGPPEVMNGDMEFWQHLLPPIFVKAYAPRGADPTDPAYTDHPIQWGPWWDERIRPRPSTQATVD